jgi:hypothetical protein
MDKKLVSSTASLPLGNSPQTRLFRISNGAYAGRQVALVQTSPTDINLTYADAPYAVWSTPQTVATDSHDADFDAVMDASGNIQIVYGENGTDYLVTRRLTFAGGSWSVGSKVTVYSGAASLAPSIALEVSGKLWVTWCRYSAPNRFVQAKSSSDNGSTWGSGGGDPGTQLTSGNPFEWSKVVTTPDQVIVIAAYGNSRIVMRSLPVAGGSWSDEMTIASGVSGFNENFDAAVRSDGLVAVVFNDTQFRYREFDGLNWGALVTLHQTPVESPQVFFRGQTPVVVFLQSWDGAQKILKVSERSSGTFSAAVPFDPKGKEFDAVLLNESGSGTYQDLTSAASNSNAADVYHSVSGALVKNSGDQILLGMSDRFRYAELVLSTTGLGGTVAFGYWDGANWKGFTPSVGSAALDQGNNRLVLWDDYLSIPVDWQKRTISGQSQFWIRLQVQSPFSRGPIGTHVTAISGLQRVIFRS